jgi:nucleoside-diphosphate-sugar epimerase
MSARSSIAVVTGAAGFIGGHLTSRLVADGWNVTGVDDERTGRWENADPQTRRVDHDLTQLDEARLRKILGGAEVLFHLAAEKHKQSEGEPERLLDVNVLATARLFRAAAAADVRKVVFTSSLYAYGSTGPDPMVETDLPAPRTIYGTSKVAGEHLLRAVAAASRLRWSVARLFFVYGPRQHPGSGYRSVIHANFERISRGERPTVYGDGQQALDYVFVDDCVDALVRLAASEADGLTVNIASGTAVSVAALTDEMLAVAGSELDPMTCAPDWTAGSRRCGSTLLAETVLGWRATTPLRVGLERVWSSREVIG